MLIDCANPVWQKATEINTQYHDKYVVCEKRFEPKGRCYRTLKAAFKVEEADAYLCKQNKDYLVILYNGMEVDDPAQYTYNIKFTPSGRSINVEPAVKKVLGWKERLSKLLHKL